MLDLIHPILSLGNPIELLLWSRGQRVVDVRNQIKLILEKGFRNHWGLMILFEHILVCSNDITRSKILKMLKSLPRADLLVLSVNQSFEMKNR